LFARRICNERNKKEAVIWFQKAAELGQREAMLNYGVCLFNGDGIETNTKEAVIWYRKAAQLGDIDAMFIYGLFCLMEVGSKEMQKKQLFGFKKQQS
jgi:TPR repeat protein